MTTAAETILLSALIAIARDRRGCQHPCHWDAPCPVCFASNMVSQVLEQPQFEGWRKKFKVTAVRQKKQRAANENPTLAEFNEHVRAFHEEHKHRQRRTKAEVLAAQRTVYGCCDRHADNKACSCLEEAAGTTGCGVCHNPNCKNPNGKH